MAEESPKTYGSLRLRGTPAELKQISSWCKEMELWVDTRDLYDRWSEERVWSFDFYDEKDFLVFYMKWQDQICGKRIHQHVN